MDYLAKQIERISVRVDELHRTVSDCVDDGEDERTALLRDALAELGVAVEELTVCGEELAEQSAQLRESEQRYADLFHRGPDGFLVTNRAGVIREANTEAAALLGWQVGLLIGKPLVVFVELDNRAEVRRATNALVRGQGRVRVETRMLRRGGRSFHASLHGIAVSGNGPDANLRWTVRDDTERRLLHDQLTYQANHDSLTGAASRAFFLGFVKEALQRASPADMGVGVLFIDVDRFKALNDRLGHQAGDELLRVVAERLRGTVRRDHLVGRLGGDEFAIACPAISPGEAHQLAERVLHALRADFALVAGLTRVTATVGVAVATHEHVMAARSDSRVHMPGGAPEDSSPGCGDGADALVRDADLAMYVAKQSGRNRYEIFSGSTRARTVARLETDAALRRAIEGGELLLRYQPQVDLHDGSLVGLEALLRWQRPGARLLTAGDFISVAEESGLITEIDRWVVTQVCRDIRRWRDGWGLGDVEVALNVYPLDITNPDFVDLLRHELGTRGLPGAHLCIEITERGEVADLETLAGPLRELRPLGLRVALDDFGTGRSSLGYLRRLPIDTVKLDQTFVAGLPASREDALIVSSVAGLADVLGLNMVAEGVERPEQVASLKALGCRVGQGFLLAGPLTPREVEDLLSAPRHAPRGLSA